MQIMFEINMTNVGPYRIVYAEKHEPGRSMTNSQPRSDNTIGAERGKYTHLVLQAEKTFLVNTRKKPCDPENKQFVTKCTDQFMQEQIGCQLPWNKDGMILNI